MSVTLMTISQTKRILCAGVLCGLTNLAYGEATEPLTSIQATAERHALASIADDQLHEVSATAAELDPRLRLRKCEVPLESFSNANNHNRVRQTIGVRCNGGKPWTLYVPVVISALADVVYTSRALTRGEAVTKEDLELRQLTLDQLPANYLASLDQLGDLEMSRSLSPGVILTLNAVKPRKLVRQGQEVIIVARAGGIHVRMTGTALRNGASGETIPVRNTNSGRTIEATVMDGNTVSVNF